MALLPPSEPAQNAFTIVSNRPPGLQEPELLGDASPGKGDPIRLEVLAHLRAHAGLGPNLSPSAFYSLAHALNDQLRISVDRVLGSALRADDADQA